MRLILLFLASLAVGVPAAAQQPGPSPDAGKSSPTQDTGDQLPVSLDRIREELKKPEDQRLRNLEVKADFVVHVQEQARIDELMSKLTFEKTPAPAGGLYGFEQQRRLFNPTDRPLQQPYAAFSGGELITIALENLIGRFLGGKIVNSLSASQRAEEEAQAHREVDQAVVDYCNGRSDWADIRLCTSPPVR